MAKCEEKKVEPHERKEIKSENESGEVAKIEVEPQEGKVSEFLEEKEKSEESVHKNESDVESALVRTDNSLSSLAISVL